MIMDSKVFIVIEYLSLSLIHLLLVRTDEFIGNFVKRAHGMMIMDSWTYICTTSITFSLVMSYITKKKRRSILVMKTKKNKNPSSIV